MVNLSTQISPYASTMLVDFAEAAHVPVPSIRGRAPNVVGKCLAKYTPAKFFKLQKTNTPSTEHSCLGNLFSTFQGAFSNCKKQIYQLPPRTPRVLRSELVQFPREEISIKHRARDSGQSRNVQQPTPSTLTTPTSSSTTKEELRWSQIWARMLRHTVGVENGGCLLWTA